MKLTSVAEENLPSLAWVLRIRRGSGDALLFHGIKVEVGSYFFVEGAWSGKFADLSFPQAKTFSGSGALFDTNGCMLCCSTHSIQAIYTIRLKDEMIASNSMVLLLKAAEAELDLQYRYHDVDIMSIMLGLDRYAKTLPTTINIPMEIHYYRNLLVTEDLHLIEIPKKISQHFECYENYVELLQNEMTSVVKNATDSKRKTQFRPLTTISSGYDSPACSVLARASGCKEAITFSTAADAFNGQNDSGMAIGQILGLRTLEFDPLEYRKMNTFPEVEFLASGYGGDDVIYCGAEKVLTNSLLFTGYHGDRIWSRNTKQGSDKIERGDPSGGSLLDFRLRVGFVNLPVPFIVCTEHATIKRISNSAEMRRWSILGTDYDRPIPRRIIEDAGVPREMFGVSKKAVARPARAADIQDPSLETFFSQSSLKDFSEWAQYIPLYPSARDRVVYQVFNLLHEGVRHTVEWLNGTFPETHGFGTFDLYRRRQTLIPWKYAKPRNTQSLLIFWAHQCLMARYHSVKLSWL